MRAINIVSGVTNGDAIVGTPINVSLTDTSGTITSTVEYVWQISTDGGLTWTTVADDTGQGTTDSYTPKEADEGGNSVYRVTANYTDTGGAQSTTKILNTDVVDAAPTLTAVSIATSAKEGDVLTASGGVPNDSDATVTYQWQSNGVNIANATAS